MFLRFLQFLTLLQTYEYVLTVSFSTTSKFAAASDEGDEHVWTMSITNLSFTVTSSSFTLNAFGAFDLHYQLQNGTKLYTCLMYISDDECQKSSCPTSSEYELTCTKVASGPMTLEFKILSTLTKLMNDSSFTLPERALQPVGLPWNFPRQRVILDYCTSSTEGMSNSHLDEESVSCDYQCTAEAQCNSDYTDIPELYATCREDVRWKLSSKCSKISECCLCWLVSLIAFLIAVVIILLLVVRCKESCSCACCPSESDLRIILIGSIAAAGLSFAGTLVGALVYETARITVTLVFGGTSLAWELGAGIYYLVEYVCEKKTSTG